MVRFARFTIVLSALALAAPLVAQTQTPAKFAVFTRNYNNQRTGANTSEKTLNTSNVNSRQFGKLFQMPVDDQVYAGLLYAPDVLIAGRKHNVLYISTVNNTVYAFDADQPGPPLWYHNFNGTGRPTDHHEVGQACRIYNDFIGNIGIVGTPVISPDRTMYFVTRTVEAGNTYQRLHAIDIATGRERPNSPQVIRATVPGIGEDSIRSVVTFNSVTNNQRSALAYSEGVVYIAWASFCDTRPYHGWMMSYDATTLRQLGVFNTTPNNRESGIWMSGAGPAFDSAGNLYVTTGNGSYNGTTEFGEALLKLQKRTLHPLDFFAPSNYNTLNEFDLDFGTQGVTVLPGTDLLVTGGKEGKVYLVDSSAMGGSAAADLQLPHVMQAIDATVRPHQSHHLHNSIPTWKGPDGVNIYAWGENDFLRAYRFDPASKKFQHPAFASADVLPPMGMPAGMMTISADGSKHGTGIVWATAPRIGDANQMTVPGNLYAFDAENLKLLWSSTSAGDDILNFAKGSPPVVANGKVYAASISSFVSVFGLRDQAPKSANLALNARATGSAPCQQPQTPDKAVNGSSQSGPTDKWCSSAEKPWLQIDLGRPVEIGRFVIEHAGAGGDDLLQNTREFNIELSEDGKQFRQVVDVWNNIQSITTHDIHPATARYVRLNILQPAQPGADPVQAGVANVYEFEVLPPITPSKDDVPRPAKMQPSLAAADPPPTKTPAAPPDVATPSGEDVEYTPSRVAMKVLQPGSGDDRPGVNDCVRARFNMWERNGKLFASSLNDAEIVCVSTAIAGVSEALRRMVPGEKRRVWIPADATYRMGEMHRMHARPEEDEAPPHEDLTCDLELVSVLHAPPTPPPTPPGRAMYTASGLAYEILAPATGTAQPAPNSTVKIQFTGWTSRGHLFESTMMTGHPALLSLAGAMPGLREALTQMKVGQKARFWIPAALAFGKDAADRFNPDGDLIYEVELLEVQ